MEDTNIQEIIKKVNEFSKLAKERELTKEEQEQRAFVRSEYIKAFKGNLINQLDSIVLVDEKGNKTKLKDKHNTN